MQAKVEQSANTSNRIRQIQMRQKEFRLACGGIPGFCRFMPRGARYTLPKVLTALGYSGQSAEVGVYRGDFSDAIMKLWARGSRHFLVDPYLEHGAGCEKKTHARQHHCRKNSQLAFDQIFEATRFALGKTHPGRAVFLRNFSTVAAATMAPSSLDFVYLDGRHDEDGVREDVRAWWPKLCPGGILAGHDYSDHQVSRALGDFMREIPITGDASSLLWITADHPASWFAFKPPPQC